MKCFCRCCGAPIITLTKKKRKFCSVSCRRKFYQRYDRSFDDQSFYSIENNFDLFRNIVANSDSYGEFQNLFANYFPLTQIKEISP